MFRKKNKIVLIFFLVFLFAGTEAWADTGINNRSGTSVFGGSYFPTKSPYIKAIEAIKYTAFYYDLLFPGLVSTSEIVFSAGIAQSYNIIPHLKIRGEVGINETKIDFKMMSISIENITLDTLSLMVAGIYFGPLKRTKECVLYTYTGAGVGALIGRGKISSEIIDDTYMLGSQITVMGDKATAMTAGGEIFGGIGETITKHFALFSEVKYIVSPGVKLNFAKAGTMDVNLGGMTWVLGVTYNY